MTVTRYFDLPAKFSDEVLDYEIGWTDLLGEGEAIVGEVVIEPSDNYTLVLNTTSNGVTRLRISGGDQPCVRIDMLATTSSGQKIGARGKLPIDIRG